ncbi:hypothetical protein EQG49_07345 [Periweissella cryptocerci]|uniref:ABC transporter permease n=1 Tax=Periweissella cryptocerci TaxID=2506420 RepID=A0A4P6YU86_9LACO|nr:ABC transporter permease [Periweissella cryptocerci]QBO36290.1 hypothetical protein EQG49_07345 [Periweissella cryptocerci]
MKYLQLEFFKMKRQHMFIPLIVIFLVNCLWFFMAIMKTANMTQRTFSFNQEYVLMEFMVVNGVFMPLFLSILASRLSAPEHENRMFNVLTINNENRQKLFNAKAAVGLIVILVSIALQYVLLKKIAEVYHISFNGHLLGITLFSLCLASFTMYVFQLLLSFFLKKQAIGITIGLVGTFMSLVTSGMISDRVTRLLPIQYIGLLTPVRMVGRLLVIKPDIFVNLVVVCLVGFALFVIAQVKSRRTMRG